MARKQTMKVYHGVPKSIVDEHTIFYASFDGTLQPELGTVGEIIGNDTNLNFKSSLTGLSVATAETKLYYRLTNDSDIITMDAILRVDGMPSDKALIYMIDTNNEPFMMASHSNGGLYYYYKNRSIELTSKIIVGYNPIRLVINSKELYAHLYINGKLVSQNNLSSISMLTNTRFNKVGIGNSVSINASFCDIRVSNIDRGDYFPNLPQDFIKGKAIIKPRMSQEQIKGDPMCSQTTTLKVPCWGSDGKYYDLNSSTSDGFTRVKDNPECYTKGSYEWKSEYGSAIKIKGMNDETISGIVDNDTAIARVTKVIESRRKCVLSSISGLVVGDSVRFSIRTAVSPECIIGEIDSSSNTITLATALESWDICEGYYMIESTASSSSPIVKTADGTTVVGTWSGLGTNEATFTLGSNSSLSGKDLYIDYSLNMPAGNSDFSQLPHSIERAWGRNGIEMKPVDEIIITDDFKGKQKGSIKECPHSSSFLASTSLMSPDSFTADSYIDYTKLYYNDYNLMSVYNSTMSGNKGQLLLTFNLIDVVERKLGCEIPGNNKVQWLKDNIEECGCFCYCYGLSPSGNKIYLTNYCYQESRWYTDYKTHTNGSISLLNYNQMNSGHDWIRKSITPAGLVHFMLFTDATDATTACNIWLDYAYVRIKLIKHSSYTALYCDNRMAREDKCNPILIQKETKTVKRYLPSKECFVTECKYIDYPSIETTPSVLLDDVHDNKLIFATTLGSGSFIATDCIYTNCINRLKTKVNPYEYSNENLYSGGYTQLIPYTLGLSDTYRGNNIYAMPKDVYNPSRYLNIKPYLKKINNELQLIVYTGEVTPNTGVYPKQLGKESWIAYSLPNRPLIK